MTSGNKADLCARLSPGLEKRYGAPMQPIYQNTLFIRNTGSDEFIYTRQSNPTICAAEEMIASLENTQAARCFSSGMAAIASSLLSCLEAGSHVVAMKNIYGGTVGFLKDTLCRMGVSTTFVEGTDIQRFADAIRPETKVIYIESPSYLYFEIVDLRSLAALASSKGITTIIDNTWSTPVFQNPHDFGIDLVVHSASKYLGGHSDIIAGAVASSGEICKRLEDRERNQLGGNMDPHQAWLLSRGMRTLAIRMKQHEQSAQRVARFLSRHDKVAGVFYPGLESHPGHSLAKTQMSGFAGLFSFVLKGTAEQADAFIAASRLLHPGCSWGGFESLVVPFGPYRGEGDKNPLQILRISVGLEDTDSLLEDIDNALRHT
jgi:cystathionine beta-lyase/cystathionine gamma-synthase